MRGREITAYAKPNYVPGSPFTLGNPGRGVLAAIAIGKKCEGVHVIKGFPVGDPVFAKATDWVEIVRCYIKTKPTH